MKISATCVLLTFISTANADLVIFQNNKEPSFDWSYMDTEFLLHKRSIALDVTKPSHMQSGENGKFTIYQGLTEAEVNITRGGSGIVTGQNVRIATEEVFRDADVDPMTFTIVKMHAQDTPIGPSLSWNNIAAAAHQQDPGAHSPSSEIFVSKGILPLEITIQDQIHYGFVSVDVVEFIGLAQLIPISWGYETTPDTPISVVPTPASGAILPIALLLSIRRQRRSRQE